MVIKHYAIISDNIPITKQTTLITYKTSGLKFLIAKKFIKKFYLKKESTNSCLLKTCKSSIRLHQYILQES
jgi:hypothetical protein